MHYLEIVDSRIFLLDLIIVLYATRCRPS